MNLNYSLKIGDGEAQPRSGLYIIPTPIGNLRDITLRAIDILASANIVACEDTRVTRRLLDAYNLHPRMIAYHEHNASKQRPRILEKLARGNVVCLVSDSGTPLISDPGYKLVQAATQAGYYVSVLPGASAVLTGILASGLPTDRFLFAGFPPPRAHARRRFFTEFVSCPASLIFFESPKRLTASIEDMWNVFGDRPAAVARELTKRFEEINNSSLSRLAKELKNKSSLKGEIVVTIGRPLQQIVTHMQVDKALIAELKNTGVKEASSAVSKALSLPRRSVYQRALALKKREL